MQEVVLQMKTDLNVIFRDYGQDNLQIRGPSCNVHVSVVTGRSAFTSALIDTGADYTLISEPLVQTLDLKSEGEQRTRSVGGAGICKVFTVNIQIENSNVVLPDWKVIAVKDIKYYGVVLGRDFLRHTVFVYDGAGLSFIFILTPEQIAMPRENRLEIVSSGIQQAFRASHISKHSP
jgi:hypothetical protein